MKANRLVRTLSSAAAAAALLAGCAAERRAPQPSPAPSPTPAPRPVATPLPVRPTSADWRDQPITSGGWSYRAEPGGGTTALFGTGLGDALLALRCERAAGRVILARSGAAQGAVPLTITTSSAARAFSAAPQPGAQPQLVVAFAPRDPLLDAIAFSRGRFAIEAPGLPTLYLPAWPEVGRVIEDCR